MGRLILVRHGESEGNRERRFTITPSVPLTARGREQAQVAARRIARRFEPALVIASPYARARETAGIIAAALSLPLEIEPNLFERRFGSLAGESYDVETAALAFDPIARWAWRPPGGGESFEDVRSRIAPVLNRLARENRDRELVIVSHGAVMMTAWIHLAGVMAGAGVPSNCGMMLVEHDGRRLAAPVIVESDDRRD
ncbi:MAG TPA: histidine phosphatase family protein [Candidatus Binataceae bacterium]|nr:histidine phosphatase family protein [Candidatus Binataceae bacterium]